MPLYKIHVEYETVIEAKSEQEGKDTAHKIIRDFNEKPLSTVASQIKTTQDLPHTWSPKSYPWNPKMAYGITQDRNVTNKTIGQSIEDETMEEYTTRKQ